MDDTKKLLYVRNAEIYPASPFNMVQFQPYFGKEIQSRISLMELNKRISLLSSST